MSKKLDLRNLRVDQLVRADHNPPGRSDMTRIDNKALTKSILVYGVLTPLLVTERRDGRFGVMEGNRRLSVCELLGFKEVPCIVVKDVKPEDLYVQANVRSNLTQNDLIHVYLKRPEAVSPQQRGRLAKIEAAVGRETLKALKTWGGTPATYAQARAVARYLGENPDGEFTKTTLNWLMLNNQTANARQALKVGVAPAQVRRAITENRPLNLRVVAE